MLAIPVLTILLASLLAAVPAVVRALRIDPVEMLRASNINGKDCGYPATVLLHHPRSRL